LRRWKKAHLPFDKPFDKLTVLSKVEGLMALTKATPGAIVANLATQIEGNVRTGLKGLEDIPEFASYLFEELFFHRGRV